MKTTQITFFGMALFGALLGCSSTESFKPDIKNIPSIGKDEAFSILHEAVRETDWRYDHDTQESSQQGKVGPGTRIYLSDTYKGDGMWTPAQFEDGTFRWVRPQDFIKK